MELERIHEFNIQGQFFYILWKPTGCLLRTIEFKPKVHRTVMDMYVNLFDGSPDYELTAEDAIEQAPLLAESMIDYIREQELIKMAEFYRSKKLQKQHPVHKISAITLDGEQYPLIWGSHNCNTYVRIADEWFFSGFVTSLNDAKNQTKAFILSTMSKSNQAMTEEDKPTSYWIASLEIFSAVFPYSREDWELLETKNVELPSEVFSSYMGIEVPFSNEKGIIGYTYVFFDKRESNTYSYLTRRAEWDSEQALEIALMLTNTLAIFYQSLEHNEPLIEIEKMEIISTNKLQILKQTKKLFAGEIKWKFTGIPVENDEEYELVCLIAKRDGKTMPKRIANCFIAMDNDLLSYLLDTDEKFATDEDTFFVTTRFKETWDEFQKLISKKQDSS